jgi:enediyne core biosynthesis thioesterase
MPTSDDLASTDLAPGEALFDTRGCADHHSPAVTDRYEYEHVVTLEETNLLGNVYFAHYLRWQGHCREHFLREHAPEIFEELDQEHALVTTRCSCEYLAELGAFDRVLVRMRLGHVVQNRLELLFEYWRKTDEDEELVARGEQELAWLTRQGDRFVPRRVPESLLEAIDAYRADSAPRV